MVNIISNKLGISDLRKIFTAGIKISKDDFYVGAEYERLPIYQDDFSSVKYHGINGICEFLRLYARNENWDYLLDLDNIIGLKHLHDTITLEPGMQFELSIKPQKSIQEIEKRLKKFDDSLFQLFDEFGIKLLSYGIYPKTTYKSIPILPKRRYYLMANYLWGILSDVMMRETAGIQACFDFDSEEDAMKKFRIANMLVPIATAMFANSPIRGCVDSGYKSFRALSWLNTDNDRCGYAFDFNKDSSFNDYINKVLDVPLIMINHDEKIYAVNKNITFRKFMEEGYEGLSADIDNFKLACNLYFPEVRLRRFIEIRNHDCVGKGLQYSLFAFYKGILYSPNILDKVDEYLSKFNKKDYTELRYNVPKLALNAKLSNITIKNIAKDLVQLAKDGLIEQQNDEEKYLEPLQELVDEGICPADIILKNWYGSWNKNIDKLIEYVSCN